MLELKYQEGIPDFVWYQEPSTWCSLHNSGSYWKAFFFFVQRGVKKNPKNMGWLGIPVGPMHYATRSAQAGERSPSFVDTLSLPLKKFPLHAYNGILK